MCFLNAVFVRYAGFAHWNYCFRERGSKSWDLPFLQRFIPEFSNATYSAFQIDKPHRHNQNPVGANGQQAPTVVY
ncbi:MAG: hypothetical protein F6K08_35870 [Okeania sp. SIO1H6]|nr:hypothetical protein [Okeania sp. SIO1H6]